MTALIECRDLVKTYSMGDMTIRALDGVSLTIERGEYVAIMGASGSGKSTLMNLFGALDRPTSGTLRVAGEDLGTLGPEAVAKFRNSAIGFVFQQFNLLARTSAVENVSLPLIYGGVPFPERQRRALERLEQLGLGERTGHHPSQLSGGQQQRVAIARALVNNPAILLADEPTGALDSKTSADIMAVFDRLNKDGITVILVTHEQEVADHARRQIVFRDGQILEDRT